MTGPTQGAFPFARVLPFAALVGQDDLRLALLLLAVSPRLGGLLVRGHKGTAKSTAARGLAAVLPPVSVVEGCRFGCPAERPAQWCDECRGRTQIGPLEMDPSELGAARLPAVERRPPFVTVPLGVTEDQLLGSIDLERALRHGEQRFRPGLLAEAHQGVLYVDEVNLLDDHIVDLLLDAAAMGVNVVAREGVSITHPSEFMLVGTMNPEEGELRPQLLDRFGLCVEIEGERDLGQRAEIVARCLEFEADPLAFHARWSGEQQSLTERVVRARALLPHVTIARTWCEAAARIALGLEVHGHRADLLLVKAASAQAALHGRTEMCDDDLEQAAALVLPHRLRRQPFEEQAEGAAELRQRARKVLEAMQEPAREAERRGGGPPKKG
jgi:Mg-chelatase subunit ChlI